MPRRRESRATSRLLVLLLSLLLVGLLTIGGVTAAASITAMATVASLSEDLPDPADLERLTFSQPTTVYDRDGKVQLGVFRR